MRHLSALTIALVALFLLAACEERSNMRDLPDRQGHAYKSAAADRPLAAGPAVPYADEQVYTVVQGDTLKSVAAKFKITVRDVIRRNDLSETHILTAGQNVIVPKAQGATAK